MFVCCARVFRACLVGACLWLCSFASAQEPASIQLEGSPLSLRDAIVITLRGNPDLKTFAYALRVQDARIDAAKLRSLPEASLEIENVLGSGDLKGVDALEATFALSQVVELGGKRAQRISVSKSGRDLMGIEEQAAQLDVLAEVNRRFIQVAGDQHQLELTRQATEIARKTVEAVQRRVDAAKSPDAELYRASVELTRAEIELQHAEHTLLASRRKLAAMWGEPEAQFGPVQADIYALPAPVEFDSLVARLQNNPDFTRFASEARLRDAEIRLAETQRKPNLQFFVGVRRFQETRDQALVLGVSAPLFAGRQATPAIAEAKALREQVDAERDAAFVKARAQLFELYQELRHAIDEAEILQRDVLPQMEKALEQTEYAYERGRYSYLELMDGQRAYLDVQRMLIDAASNAQTLQSEIERLSGEPLAANNQ